MAVNEEQYQKLLADYTELLARLEETEDTIRAIREGEVDALVMSGPQGEQVYTLQGSERAYRLLVEAMNEGALVLTPDGTIAYANRTFAAILCAPLEKLMGSSIFNYICEQDVDDVKALLELGLKKKGRAEIGLKKDGVANTIPAHVSVGNLELDETEVLSAVVTDLSEQKRTEAELTQYREHLEELVEMRTLELIEANRKTVGVLESIGDAFVSLDQNWRFEYVNNRAEDLLGYSRGELLGKSIWDIFPNALGTPFQEACQNAANTGEMAHIETHSPVAERWIDNRIYPSPDGISIYFDDITERKLFEQSQRKLLERERHIAEVLQGTLVPQELPEKLYGCNIAMKYQPALREAEVGGDFFDVFDLGEGKIGVLIGDVAGKGLEAAVRVAETRYSVRGYAHVDFSPARVLTRVNEVLCKGSFDEARMLTAFFAVIDTATNTITYANAAHEPPIVIGPDCSWTEFETTGMPLGVSQDISYYENSYELKPGDRIVMITDGISEARAKGVVLFEKRGVIEYLLDNCNASPSQMISGLLAAATAHAGGQLQDDAALVVFECGEHDQT